MASYGIKTDPKSLCILMHALLGFPRNNCVGPARIVRPLVVGDTVSFRFDTTRSILPLIPLMRYLSIPILTADEACMCRLATFFSSSLCCLQFAHTALDASPNSVIESIVIISSCTATSFKPFS